MRKYLVGVFLLISFIALSFTNSFAESRKFLVVLQAGAETHEGTARAVHALLYSKELKSHGHEVVLVFDGAGTEWVEKWAKADSTDKLANSYKELREMGITQVVCDFCASAFKVKESLQNSEVTLSDEYQGHPSIAEWVDKGYEIIIL